MAAASESSGRRTDITGVVVGLALAVCVGLAAWLLANRSAPDGTQTATFGPAIVDEATLRVELAGVDHTVYGLAGTDGAATELTIAGDGSVQIRYLPAPAAEPAGQYPTVLSWPMADPMARALTAAQEDAAMSEPGPDGQLFVTSSDTPYNAFQAQPAATALGEVFDPEPGAAWKTVTDGDVVTLRP